MKAVDPDLDVLCRFGGHEPAVGVYHAPDGCICFADKVQALCSQHVYKAEQNGVRLILLLDLRMKP